MRESPPPRVHLHLCVNAVPKLVLFDIDETMISSDGAGRRAIGRLLRERHEVEDEHLNLSMSGKTDPQIIREILTALHIPEKEIQRTVEETAERYLELLQEEIGKSGYYIVHEGVVELLAAIVKHPHLYLGLLTGNVEKGARMKLEQFGLNTHFPMGAYGSDSGNRLELPAIAQQRARDHYGITFLPEETVIIGDSVNDILCARGYGAVSIAVNTGKTAWEELVREEPDYLFKSLGETEEIMAAILNGKPARLT